MTLHCLSRALLAEPLLSTAHSLIQHRNAGLNRPEVPLCSSEERVHEIERYVVQKPLLSPDHTSKHSSSFCRHVSYSLLQIVHVEGTVDGTDFHVVEGNPYSGCLTVSTAHEPLGVWAVDP